MTADVINFSEWLEESSLATLIRQSLWLYPVLEIIHIMGIVLLAGGALMFDLRLLGFSKVLPANVLARHLLKWSVRGLVLVVPSGLLLFITNAGTLARDPVFVLKIALLLVAGANAAVFRYTSFQSLKLGEGDSFYSAGYAKITAIISMVVWISVIACGRLLAY